ncbi:hypothetical protein Tco_1361376 [Tanacetum coccineum]
MSLLLNQCTTYTSVYTDSEPDRAFWGADDEEISEGGIPRVIVLGYDRLPMQPVAPPSPDYIPGPEDPQTPPVPQDEDEREPMFVQAHDPDYVSEPIYPEYIPLEDEHEFLAEEQPLPPVDSPTAESPGYVTESDPEEDPEEYEDDETEDGPVDYPMDGGDDGDDDDGDSSGDDADDENDEEEEHLAPVNSTIAVPVDEPVFPPEGTEPVIPPPSTDITIGDEIPESEQPPHKRLCLSTLGSRYEVEESFTARPTRCQGIDYGFVSKVDAEERRQGIRDVGSQYEWWRRRLASQEAWTHSIGLSQATHQEIQTHRDHVYAHETHLQAHQTQLQLQDSRVIRDMRREMSDYSRVVLTARAAEESIDANDQWLEFQITSGMLIVTSSGLCYFVLLGRCTGIQIMAHTTRRGHNTPTSNTNPNNMTPESIQAMINQALLQNSTNGDGSHSSYEDNRRNVQTARPSFYADFMKCQPLNFKGTEGMVGLTRWIEKMDVSFHFISGCAMRISKKFANLHLLGAGFAWWNGQIRTLGHEAYAMTWEVKGNDVPAYTERFQELTLICTKFVANETEKVDKYISGLPDNIYGNVKSARPKTLDETIELANDISSSVCDESGHFDRWERSPSRILAQLSIFQSQPINFFIIAKHQLWPFDQAVGNLKIAAVIPLM